MIYLLRHGKLKTDHQKRFIGQVDLELSKTGLSQASNWAKWLIPVPIDKIYASDLNRTATTAKIIAEQIKRPIHFEAGFREINLGRWENLPFTEVLKTCTNVLPKPLKKCSIIPKKAYWLLHMQV